MGLGSSRKRAKLSHDPNNTKWTRATTNFGHQQLLAQGWTPGTNLGASNPAYAQFHTKISASHIRITPTVENLGLGATQGHNHMLVEYTGLDAFQGLLGRLNGKSEVDLEKEQKVRDDLKATMYAERKRGGLRFISGGFLAGTREEDPEEVIASTADAQDSLATSASAIKIGDGEDVSSRMEDDSPPIEVAAKDLPINIVKEIEHGAVIESNPSNAKRKAEKAQRKLDRRERREAKRVKREARQAKQEQRLESQTPTASPNTEVTHVSKKARITDASPPLTEERPPTQQPKVLQGSQMSLPVGRHAIRHRHIQQKRMAFLHPKALNEILMIKA